MAIRLEHLIILALLLFILFRETKNEEVIRFVDYAGRKYEYYIDRRVH